MYLDFVVVNHDRVVSFLLFADAITPFSQNEKENMVEAVASRMERTASDS